MVRSKSLVGYLRGLHGGRLLYLCKCRQAVVFIQEGCADAPKKDATKAIERL